MQNNKIEIYNIFEKLANSTRGMTKFSFANNEKNVVSMGQCILNKYLVDNGTFSLYTANIFESFGYVDGFLITDFPLDSVLRGIDGD